MHRIASLLCRAASRNGPLTAFVDLHRALSHAEFEDLVARAQGFLTEAGVPSDGTPLMNRISS